MELSRGLPETFGKLFHPPVRGKPHGVILKFSRCPLPPVRHGKGRDTLYFFSKLAPIGLKVLMLFTHFRNWKLESENGVKICMQKALRCYAKLMDGVCCKHAF
jgi:hypothetical protein